ncbi:hypothetical protein [Clostridium sp.]|uniref:hypothetical protein n=1 Tax=Clostridium sp. TaxID=1506 RepID=UPI003F2B9D57
MNKKISIVFIILTMMFALQGCESRIVKKSLEDAKIYVEAKEYDKALESLAIVLEKDKENKEAKNLNEIINSYKTIVKLVESEKFDEVNKILEKLDETYKQYVIRDDIDLLINKVNNYYKEVEKIDICIKDAESIFNENKYEECRDLLRKNIIGDNESGSKLSKYIKEEHIKKAKELVEKCDLALAEIEAKRIAEEEALKEQAIVVEEEAINVSSYEYYEEGVYEENTYEEEPLLNGRPRSEELRRVIDLVQSVYKKVEEAAKQLEEERRRELEGMN